VNVVREDPVRKGLLFAGTERAVFVSLNDGDDWLPLRQKMPATSIRDLVIHDDDVVVATHGRSFWILDDISPLRQIDAKVAESAAHMFRPQLAHRVRWNVNTDTPLPPDEPAGQNPPDGAILYYFLKEAPPGPVTLEIIDIKGNLVRKFSSADKPETIEADELNVPTYWVRPPQELSAKAGMHRFVWDLHYPSPPGQKDLPISAVFKNTPAEPRGPWVLPGDYKVRLTVGEKTYEQPLTVKMDPRVKMAAEDQEQQLELSLQCCDRRRDVEQAIDQVSTSREQLKKVQEKVKDESLKKALSELDRKMGKLEGTVPDEDEHPIGKPGPSTLRRLSGEQDRLLEILQGADAAPTPQAVAACSETQKACKDLLKSWQELVDTDVKAMNERLRKLELPELMPGKR
jgi:hypothetical protein